MKTDIETKGALRLSSCTYGISRIPFRGPRKPTDGRFVAFVGGTHTIARHVDQPFVDRVGEELGEVCVNLGCQSAGPDVFLFDTALGALCHDAAACVVQVLSAANLSNRFYKVHPRRNDRFIAPKEPLSRLFPEIDFAEIAFTGHLIETLRATDPERFKLVAEVLQATWVRRMKALIAQAAGPVVLLWITEAGPEGDQAGQATDLTLVRRSMIDGLRGDVSGVVEVASGAGDLEGLHYAPLEALAVRDAMSVKAHAAASRALSPALRKALT